MKKLIPPEKIFAWITVRRGQKLLRVPITARFLKKFGLKVVDPESLPESLKTFLVPSSKYLFEVVPKIPRHTTLRELKILRNALRRIERRFPRLFEDTTFLVGDVYINGVKGPVKGIFLDPVSVRDLWKYTTESKGIIDIHSKYLSQAGQVLREQLSLLRRWKSKRLWICSWPFDPYAVYHEPGHLLYGRLPSKWRKVWREVYWPRFRDVTPYAKTNPIEGFAEAFRLYMGYVNTDWSFYGGGKLAVISLKKGVKEWETWFDRKELHAFYNSGAHRFFQQVERIWKK